MFSLVSIFEEVRKMKRSLNFYFVVLKLSHNIYCFICLSWCAYIRSFVVPTKTTKTGILRININSQYQVILKISVPVLFKPGMPMLNKKVLHNIRTKISFRQIRQHSLLKINPLLYLKHTTNVHYWLIFPNSLDNFKQLLVTKLYLNNYW